MLRVASWNTSHWSYSRLVPQHKQCVWNYLADLEVDVALVQEAVAPAGSKRWSHFVPQAPWRIDESRPWGSGIATQAIHAQEVRSTYTRWSARHEFDLTPASNHKGAVAIADLQVPEFGVITVISVYALTTLFRIIAELIPLFDSGKKTQQHFILGGDLNAHTQNPHPLELPRYKAIFTAIESLGLVNCFKATTHLRPKLEGCPCDEPECFHVQTRRHRRHVGTPKEKYSAQNDYLYASPDVAEALTDCYAVGSRDESVWQLSDHCPIVAEFSSA